MGAKITGFWRQKIGLTLRFSISDMIQYFHSKSIPAFQLGQRDVFRAQGHRLTPSGLCDMGCQSQKTFIFTQIPIVNPCVRHMGLINFLVKMRSIQLHRAASRSLEGVRRCPWALYTPPWTNKNTRIDLEWKYWIISELYRCQSQIDILSSKSGPPKIWQRGLVE